MIVSRSARKSIVTASPGLTTRTTVDDIPAPLKPIEGELVLKTSMDKLSGTDLPDTLKAKGIDTIAVTGVNDVFVMNAWKKASGSDDIEFLADGSANWAKAVGFTADLTERGLGVRSGRYAMVVDDGVVKTLNVEEAPGKAEASGAENLLKSL